ncbi:MAG: MFS transporter [Acidobacteria bacterium]|nr:MFS transporter [Acidobacteriota bacterium]
MVRWSDFYGVTIFSTNFAHVFFSSFPYVTLISGQVLAVTVQIILQRFLSAN